MDKSPTDTVPLVGYMTTDDAAVAWRKRKALFQEVAADAKQAGVSVILFNWYGVDFARAQVRGWMPQGQQWVAAVRPLPDAIYELTSYRTGRKIDSVKAVCKRLAEDHGIPFVNRLPPFGKWAVYKVLKASDETGHLQPETVQFQDFKVLDRMVKRHGTVYLKYSYGSEGSSVMRVRPEAGGWGLKGRCRGKPIDRTFSDLISLHHFLAGLRLKNWVIQQGVNGAKVGGTTFDLRVMAQKDGQGKWDIAPGLLRWATPKNDVANNVALGAKLLNPADFIRKFGPHVQGLPTLEARAAEASLKVAKVLGDHYDTIGEIGVDVCLDQDDRIWVFEVNPKPARRPGYAMHQRIFAYCRYLARKKAATSTRQG